ncbi:MAG: Pkinase-domain-containing protein [Podila humilis]|nr:MAG: Pkinase-domain-containing protein [Podila humilis]
MSSKRIVTGDTIYANQLFTRQELVGRGAYGSVYKGVENATQQVVAIKVLNLDTEEEDVSDIQREIATLSQLKNCDSQNITRYHGSFLNGTKLWIVMDYAAGGSIRSLLRMGKIEEKCIAVIAREVLQALDYLHKHRIIHRDIKAANILLTDEGRVQLCDFGVAGQVTMNSLKRNSFVGTPYWMAPEVIKEGQTYDYKADIWSFGITIYEIATGNPPFADQEPMRAVTLIPKSRPAQLEGDWSPAMKEFVALCLHEEPNERPSAEDLLKTKWIKSTNKNSVVLLKDLVARYELFKRDSSVHKDETSSEIDIDHELENFDMEVDLDAWRFDVGR